MFVFLLSTVSKSLKKCNVISKITKLKIYMPKGVFACHYFCFELLISFNYLSYVKAFVD